MLPVALQAGDVVRVRCQQWTVSRQVGYGAAAVLEVVGCGTGNRGITARFLLPFEPFEQMPRPTAPLVVTPRRWRRLARRHLADAVPAYRSLRTLAGAAIDLLPFQLEPALAVVGGRASRILVADEVGLGKTVQAALIVAEVLARDPRARALIVTPASLRDQWQLELHARFGLEARVLGAGATARPAAPLQAGDHPWSVPLAIASIDLVKRPEVLRALEGLLWDVLVVDEAHHAAGASDRHAAVADVATRARTVVMLSATPHNGDDEAFARLADIGNIGGRFPLAVFRRTRGEAGASAGRRTVWLRVSPSGTALAMHEALTRYVRRVWRATSTGRDAAAARLAMIVLTKRATSSAASLARSIERRMHLLEHRRDDHRSQPSLPFGPVEDADEEPDAQLAAAGLADWTEERYHLGAVLALARAARRDDCKIRALARLLRRARQPAIVFTEYRDTLSDVVAALNDHPAALLHGGQTPAERRAALSQFVGGEAALLLATDAAGEGLNLHERCRLVVSLELPWNPVRLEQRVGRVDRIGQRRRVHHVCLIGAGTAEERHVAHTVRRRQQRITDAMRAFTPAARVRPPSFDDGELLELIVAGGHRVDVESSVARRGRAVVEGFAGASPQADALNEAARAASCRALVPASRDSATRLFVTTVGRRSTLGWWPGRALWAFTLELAATDGELLFDVMFGVSHELAAIAARRSDVREIAARTRNDLQHAVEAHAGELRAALLSAARAHLGLAADRERAIAGLLLRRHRSLAAALAQRELFGNLRTADAVTRHGVVEQAMSSCRERLERLEQWQRAVCTIAPVLAVLPRA